MFKFVVFFVALAVTAQLPSSFGFFSGDAADGSRMVGGDVVTDIGTYSFQVAIRPSRLQGGVNVTLPVCSGVLVKGLNSTGGDAYWVLTSATCVLSGTDYKVYLGTNKVTALTAPDMVADSSAPIIHPEYLSTFKAGDLALIPDQNDAIATIISGSNTNKIVTTALLPKVDDAGAGYLLSSVKMAGWGQPNEAFASTSPSLRQLNSRVVGNVACTLAHLGKPITGKHICTNGLINKGPCTGDSGAPLILNADNRVIGLATLVPSSGCSKGTPGIFTRMGSYLAWIVKETNYDADQ